MDTAYIERMSMPTRGKNRTGILPFQMDLQMLEELYPIITQNSDPIFLRSNGYIINSNFNGKNYVFVDDDLTGGGDTVELPEGRKIGFKAVFQNDRKKKCAVYLPEHAVILTEEKWITRAKYEENPHKYNFVRENLTNNTVLVNPIEIMPEEFINIPPMEAREARWNGKTWEFREFNESITLRDDEYEVDPFERERFIKIAQDANTVYVRAAEETWDYFQFLNQTDSVAAIHLQIPVDGEITEDWKETGAYQTITINPECMVYTYWNGIEWKVVLGFEDERTMIGRIQALEDKICNGIIEVPTQPPRSNNKKMANTEYVDKAISDYGCPIGTEYTQYDINGIHPSQLFNTMKDGVWVGTTWEGPIFKDGVFFKTEGGDNEDANPTRVNGIQPDGIRDFGWEQTHTAEDHEHTLSARNQTQGITVTAAATGSTTVPHTHTINAGTASAGTHSHSTSGSVSCSPSSIVSGVSGSTSAVAANGSISVVTSVTPSTSSISGSFSTASGGSHSHTVSIPSTTTTTESAPHTHTVNASGNNLIEVEGQTISGGTHSHTYSFKYRDLYLLDLLGNPTTVKVPIAGETTVKNRKMRIWRRTA